MLNLATSSGNMVAKSTLLMHSTNLKTELITNLAWSAKCFENSEKSYGSSVLTRNYPKNDNPRKKPTWKRQRPSSRSLLGLFDSWIFHQRSAEKYTSRFLRKHLSRFMAVREQRSS